MSNGVDINKARQELQTKAEKLEKELAQCREELQALDKAEAIIKRVVGSGDNRTTSPRSLTAAQALFTAKHLNQVLERGELKKRVLDAINAEGAFIAASDVQRIVVNGGYPAGKNLAISISKTLNRLTEDGEIVKSVLDNGRVTFGPKGLLQISLSAG